MSKTTKHFLNDIAVEGIIANNELGTAGQALMSDGDKTYWGQGAGFTGSRGGQGFTGSKGYTGSQGAGFTGSRGDQGLTGSQGVIGFTGSKGDQGDTGSQGVIGFTGSKGDQGFTGSQGVIGYTGSQGVIGYTGSRGFTGSKGDTGFVGSQGVIGYTGSRGYTGSKGDTGSASTVEGPQGIQGFTGSQGVIGYTGSRGATGFVGSRGTQGIQGVIGYTGSASTVEGPQGIQGVIGYTGSRGTQGVIGFTGSQGVQGVIGYTGSRGTQGIQGVIGYTGSRGSPDTAAEVLAKLLTVDGSGSGLDADLLDGQQGNYYYPRSGGATGYLDWDGHSPVLYGSTSMVGGWSRNYQLKSDPSGTDTFYMGAYGSAQGITYGYIGLGTYGVENVLRLSSTEVSWGTNVIWHTGNDGSGSGLDADLLDGQQGSAYLRSNVAATKTGTTVFNDRVGIGVSTTGGQQLNVLSSGADVTARFATDTNGDNALIRLQAKNNAGSLGYADISFSAQTNNLTFANPYNTGNPLTLRNAGQLDIRSNTATPLTLYRSNSDSNIGIDFQGSAGNRLFMGLGGVGRLMVKTDSNLVTGNEIWHSGNDGSGSGLDADLLDGVQGSAYLRANATDTATGALTFNGTTAFNNPMTVNNGLSTYQNTVNNIVNPGGASFSESVQTVAGAIKIKLPIAKANTMLRMTVKIFGYTSGHSMSFDIGGYAYSSTSWPAAFATQISMDNAPPLNVRFGKDGTTACIWIGDLDTVWSYPKIVVTDAQIGHSAQTSGWEDGWTISRVTSFDTVETGPILASLAKGYTGSRGTNGTNGSNGATGFTGSRGTTGANGSNGATGYTGSRGTTGANGSNGATGYTGSRGTQGVIGYTGSGYGTAANVQMRSLGVNTAASGTAGEIRATNNITAYYSDDRLKTRLSNIPDALKKLLDLNGFYYEANETAVGLGYTKKREVGVSAQEVQKVLPEIVVPAPISDKYLTVHYEKLIPLLIEAIKEQQLQINELKGLI